MPLAVKTRYFELIRTGMKGAAAARLVGVSTSCGSLWFIEAGRMAPHDKRVSERFLTQDERIAIAEALRTDTPIAQIAAELGRHRSTIYREIARGRTDTLHHADTYHPWWSHNQVLLRRARPSSARSGVARNCTRWSRRNSRGTGPPSRSRATSSASTRWSR